MRKKIIIMGAAGRDFHNFNVVFRNNRDFEVIAFTAAQIPGIADRVYPSELAGTLYPDGIPIYPENELADLIGHRCVDEVVFAYSDVTNEAVMAAGALATAFGADFRLLGVDATMLLSEKRVISVGAVRTGCGKSQVARALARLLRDRGQKVAVLRHPMPYGDLNRQRCQRFACLADLDHYDCTIEEREEYEMHLSAGHLLFAGVDYQEIVRNAEKEADVLLWDGGNNDTPFIRPDLHIVLADPLRPGHELTYYPSQANVRLADFVVLAKSGSATEEAKAQVEKNVRRINPTATIWRADSVVSIDRPEQIRAKRVVVVEDGPTLTHGGMAFGAGTVAAQRYDVSERIDPRPYAKGSLRGVLAQYPHLDKAIPAMGYTDEQVRDLEATLNAVPCDAVVVGTPVNLAGVLRCRHPMVRVRYELDEPTVARLGRLLDSLLRMAA